jgi:predicted metal-dependent hydrolase
MTITPTTIHAAGREIDLQIKRLKQSRRIVIRWNPLKETLTLSIPTRCTTARAMEFLEERQDWIEKTVGKMPDKVAFEFGTKIPVLGEELRIVEANRAPSGEGWLPILSTPARCAETVQTILKNRLKHYIGEMAEEMADQIGAKLTRITIRDTISRWGSCSVDGSLSFSWRLIFAPREVLDYVIAHEVAHLKQHNHSPEFWYLVAQLIPDYPKHRRWLKANGRNLYQYGE